MCVSVWKRESLRGQTMETSCGNFSEEATVYHNKWDVCVSTERVKYVVQYVGALDKLIQSVFKCDKVMK